MAFRLAAQGLNVVIAAMPDALLEDTLAALRKAYPSLAFRGVGVNLSAAAFMPDIAAATADIHVQVCCAPPSDAPDSGGAVEGGTRVVQCIAHRGAACVSRSLSVRVVWLVLFCESRSVVDVAAAVLLE